MHIQIKKIEKSYSSNAKGGNLLALPLQICKKKNTLKKKMHFSIQSDFNRRL